MTERNSKKSPVSHTGLLASTQGGSLLGLLNGGHQEGLTAISSKVIQHPHTNNGHMAIVQVQLTTEKGVFTATGAASPEVGTQWALAPLVEWAENRALERALCWANPHTLPIVAEPAESENPDSIPIQRPQALTPSQSRAIQKLAFYLGWTSESLREDIELRFGKSLDTLNRLEASQFIRELQKQKAVQVC